MTPNERTFIDTLLRLRRHATLTRPQFEAERLGRFRQLARWACERSPYYRALIRERGIDVDACSAADFPVLTKRLLRENFDAIATDPRVTLAGVEAFLQRSRSSEERFLGEFAVLHTSGSSGEVAVVVYSEADWVRGFASASRLNRGRGRHRLAYYGATSGHYAGVSMGALSRSVLGASLYDYAAIEINAPVATAVRALNAYQPDVLVGYATGLKALAAAAASGALKIRPNVLHSGGEPLSPRDHRLLEGCFGCPCLNVYVATETLLIGYGGAGDPGLSILDDDLILEPAGDHVLATNLFNTTLPLIRYQLSDTWQLSGAPSPLGPYPVVATVAGRDEEAPEFRSAGGQRESISPIVLSEMFTPGVWRFQLRQENDTRFRFAVCLHANLGIAARAAAVRGVAARLDEILSEKGLSSVSFAIDVVDDIPPDARTGKFRLVRQASAG